MDVREPATATATTGQSGLPAETLVAATPRQPAVPMDTTGQPSCAPEASTPTPAEPVSETPATLVREDAPPLGKRIEVLWKITHDGDAVEERWWGAVVQDRLPETVGAFQPEYSSRHIHILLYDAYGEFEEDVSRVAFLPNGVLFDLAQAADENKGLLDWRSEEDPSALPVQMSLDDVVQANAADLAEAGLSDDADIRYLSKMPAHVQRHMTSGYRVFADGVKEMLSELSAKHPEGYVVTESDIREMCARIKR